MTYLSGFLVVPAFIWGYSSGVESEGPTLNLKTRLPDFVPGSFLLFILMAQFLFSIMLLRTRFFRSIYNVSKARIFLRVSFLAQVFEPPEVKSDRITKPFNFQLLCFEKSRAKQNIHRVKFFGWRLSRVMDRTWASTPHEYPQIKAGTTRNPKRLVIILEIFFSFQPSQPLCVLQRVHFWPTDATPFGLAFVIYNCNNIFF